MPKKSTLEKAFGEIGVKPVTRRKIHGFDILIGDGFVTDPHLKLQKFGVEEGDFPNGCYCTTWLWSTDDSNVGLGMPLFFDCLHDIDKPLSTRQTMRINSVVKDADRHMATLKEAKKHAS